MSESKYILGPWAKTPSSIFPNEHEIIRGGIVIAQVAGCSDDGSSYDECEANANLIAAAPDLLAALEEWVTAFGPVEVPNTQGADLLAKSRAAIAKAKGEPA